MADWLQGQRGRWTFPVVALVILVGVEVGQLGVPLALLGIPDALELTLVLAVAALAVLGYQGKLRLRWSPVLTGGLVYLASQAATVPTAKEPSVAWSTVLGDARDLLMLVMVYLLVISTKRVNTAVFAATLPLVLLAGLSAVQQFLLHDSSNLGNFSVVSAIADVGATTRRHSGPIGDPNFWGRVLVTYAPLCFYFAMRATKRRIKAWWIVGGVVLVLGLYLSQSRGAFIAIFVAVLALMCLSGWRVGRWLALAPVVIALLLVLPQTGPRLLTLTQLSQSSTGAGDQSLVVRLASANAGLLMFDQNPILGIGAGNYTDESISYEKGLAFATSGELNAGVAPHNSYLESLAEGGVVGFAGLMTLFGTGFWCAARAWRLAPRGRAPNARNPERLLAAACMAALTGWCVASAVLHVRQFRTLLVLIAICGAIYDLAQREERPRLRLTGGTFADFSRRAAAGLLILGLLGSGVVEFGGKQTEWSSKSILVIVPRGPQVYRLRSYIIDLLSRSTAAPTLAFIAGSDSVRDPAKASLRAGFGTLPTPHLTAALDPRATVIDITVTGNNEAYVRSYATAVGASATRAINELDTLYTVQPSPGGSVVSHRSTYRPQVLYPVAALWLLVAGMGLWRWRRRRYASAVEAYEAFTAATAAQGLSIRSTTPEPSAEPTEAR